MDAAGPVVTALAAERGYSQLAVSGSLARGQDFLRFRQLIEKVLGHQVDLVSHGGRKPSVDDDIRREAVLL